MSYTSIFKTLPEALRHPVGLAMIGSLAFHGFLFAGVPFLPVSSKALKSERLVRLIQLSPAEQNRLPQVSGSLTTPIPPALPSDPSSLVLPPLSELPDFSSQPNLSASNLPPFSLNSTPPIRVSPGQPLPSGPSIPIPGGLANASPSGPNPDIFPPPPNTKPKLPDLADAPRPFPEDNSPLSPDFGLPANSPDLSSQAPSDQATSPPEAGTPENLKTWLTKAREISGTQELAFQNANVPFVYPEAACQDRAEGLAFVGVLVKPNGEEAPEPAIEILGDSGNKTLNDAAVAAVKNHQFGPTGQYQAFLPSFQFKYSDQVCAAENSTPQPSPENSTPQPSPERSTAYGQWLADARKLSNNPRLEAAAVKIPYTYPEAACKERLQGSASVAALVKPDGGLAEDPELISATGQQSLDNAAIKTVKDSQFRATGQYQALVSSFQFQYSETVCSKETTPPQSPSKGSEKAPSQPLPKNSNSSKDSNSPDPSRESASESPQKSNQPASQSSSEPSEEVAPQSSPVDSGESTPQVSPETTEEPKPPETTEEPKSQQQAPETPEATTTP